MQSQTSTLTENGQATRRERLYFLDWLRVFAILVVFFIGSNVRLSQTR